MIKKIELKIFLIIFALLFIMITVVISYNAYNSYNSTIRGITLYIERSFDDRHLFEKEKIDGLYEVKVLDGKVVEDEKYSDEIKEYAKKIIDNNLDSGIIGKYIYKNRNHLGLDNRRWNGFTIWKWRYNKWY